MATQFGEKAFIVDTLSIANGIFYKGTIYQYFKNF